MLYHMHELTRLAMMPWRGAAQMARMTMSAPWNPLAYTPYAQQILDGTEVFKSVRRRYGKPGWAPPTTVIDGRVGAITGATPILCRRNARLIEIEGDRTKKTQ